MHATRSLQGDWGGRAPLWLHRRHRGGALEALRRCLVDKSMAQVLDVRRCRRRPSWWAHCCPSPDCDTRGAWGICAVIHPPGRGRLRAVSHAGHQSQQAAREERVRAPLNGARLQHCRWQEAKLRDGLTMHSAVAKRRVWRDAMRRTAGAARAPIGLRRADAVMLKERRAHKNGLTRACREKGEPHFRTTRIWPATRRHIQG